jgi:hypothetical protein
LVHGIGDSMLVYSNSIYINEAGERTGRLLTTKFNLHDHPDPRSFIFGNTVWGHSAMIRTELLKFALPIPDGAPYDCWLGYVASSVSTVHYHDEPLTLWRQHEKSFSSIYYDNKDKERNLQWDDWVTNSRWIEAMCSLRENRYPDFFQRIKHLYSLKNKKSYVWPLFRFLYRHRSILFKVWRRNFFSQLNEFRKMARGVKDS